MNDVIAAIKQVASPYPGLRPFRDDEAGIFFGREQQIDLMLTRLETHRFMAVVGTSGCGKSSLVRAGLIPALEQGLLGGAYPNWRIAVMRPGDAPFECLTTALLESKALRERAHDPRAAAFLEATLRRGPLGLLEAIQETRLPAETNILLVVDQFEEIFRYRQQARNVNDADAFVNLLVASAQPPKDQPLSSNPLYIVITMRSDFIGDCALFIGLPELVSETDFLTPKMTRAQYRNAIVEPARVFGWALKDNLVNRLLNDLGDAPDQLPLLQHALMRMWVLANAAPRPEKRLTLADYVAVGGLQEALSRHADEALNELTEEQWQLVEILFRCLSERGAGQRDTRRPVKLKQVAAVAAVDSAALFPVVEAFRRPDRSFLMPPVPTPLTSDTLLDISHESLISHWPRLNEWVEKEAASAAAYSRLIDAAELYRQDQAALLSGVALERALQWRDRDKPNAAWAARYGGDFKQTVAFLDESVKADKINRRKAGRQRLMVRLLAPLSIALLLLIGLSVFALRQWSEAQQAAAEARQSAANARIANLALESSDSRETAPDLSLALALHAVRLSNISNSKDIGGEERNTAEQALRGALAATGSRLLSGGHQAPVSKLVTSPDGRWLASVSWDRSVRLWDLRNDPPTVCRALGNQRDGPTRVAFSPNGRWLAITGKDGVVNLWALDRPCNSAQAPETEPQDRLAAPEPNSFETLTAIAFSPGRQDSLLVVGSDKGVVRLWDMSNRLAGPQTLEKKHEDDITALEFSPDGHLLASASADKTVRIWDVSQESVGATWRRDFTRHQNRITALAFSPSGYWLASADTEGVIYRWDPSNESVNSILLKGHDDAVSAIAFRLKEQKEQKEQTLISASRDGAVLLWDIATEPPPKPATFLRQNAISALALAQDNYRLFSANPRERLIRVWDLNQPATVEPRQLWGNRSPVGALAFTSGPNGPRLLSANRKAEVRQWDLMTPFPTNIELAGLGQKDFTPLNVTALSPQGRWLAVAGESAAPNGVLAGENAASHQVALWDLTAPATAPRMLAARAPVIALAFSLDGRRLAAANKNREILLWEDPAPTATAPQVLSDDEKNEITALVFSPSERWLASVDRGEQGRLRLWDLSTSRPLLLPSRDVEHSAITAIAFSPNGHILACATQDMMIRLWSLDDGREIQAIQHYEALATTLAFSPDGATLAVGGADSMVRLWELANPARPARVLRGQERAIVMLAFSPDGRLLASSAADGSVFIWRTEVEALVDVACTYTRDLSWEEWQTYMKNTPYHQTCPDQGQ